MKRLLFVLTLILASFLIIGCDSDDEITSSVPETPALTEDLASTVEPTTEPQDDVVITIGNLTDQTGPSANAVSVINGALDDLVDYCNETSFIPGVKLKVVTYDGQLDPSRDIPGYEWLLSKGADLIYTSVPTSPVTLASRVNREKVVLFTPSIPLKELSPPGFIFDTGNVPEHDAYTLLKWIAENDWDYQANGPAKIGGAGWTDSYDIEFMDALERYAEAHPDKFEFIGSYAKEFTFLWSTEVEALKDADYIFPPSIPITLMKQYRKAGHDGKFICGETHAAFMGLIGKADIWDEVDGTLYIRTSRWWTESDPVIDFTNRILDERHSSNKATEIRQMGAGYLALGTTLYAIVDIIRIAAKTVGPENIDSQALCDAAESYSLIVDDVARYSFSEAKRYLVDYLRVFRADGVQKDLVPLSDEWLPVVLEP